MSSIEDDLVRRTEYLLARTPVQSRVEARRLEAQKDVATSLLAEYNAAKDPVRCANRCAQLQWICCYVGGAFTGALVLAKLTLPAAAACACPSWSTFGWGTFSATAAGGCTRMAGNHALIQLEKARKALEEHLDTVAPLAPGTACGHHNPTDPSALSDPLLTSRSDSRVGSNAASAPVFEVIRRGPPVYAKVDGERMMQGGDDVEMVAPI